MRPEGIEVFVRAPAKQQRAGRGHRIGGHLTLLRAGVGSRPAAVLETAATILVRAPRSLHHPVEGETDENDDVSHAGDSCAASHVGSSRPEVFKSELSDPSGDVVHVESGAGDA